MKNTTFKVIVNHRTYKNISGLYSIYLRITINRISKYVKIPNLQKIDYKDFNSKAKGENYVKNSNPNAFIINKTIIDFKQKVSEIVYKLISSKKQLTHSNIYEFLNTKSEFLTFNDFVKNYIKHPKEKLELATLTKYKTFSSHLDAFKSSISFEELTSELVINFKKFLEVDKGFLGSTIKSYFDKFKKIVTQAEREGYLDYSQTRFLFTDAKIKINKAKRTYLEIEEVIRIKNLSFSSENSHLERTRDLFLFQIYTGFYYNDLRILLKENLKDCDLGKYIIGNRDKNGNVAIVPLFKFENAEVIIDKYKAVAEDDLMFNEYHFIQDQVYNRQLKEIGKMAMLKQSISNKVARHTNVQWWIRYGAERPIISKMVGHIKEATTKEYYDVNVLDVLEGTKNVNFKELGI